LNAVVEQVRVVSLPEPVARRGISEAQWRTLANNLYPGAASDSVLMVWDYCVARKLDPLKKPCHIVPMQVRDSKSGDYIWRDVVMAGIYEYRTTATRTGLYLGHSIPEYGPAVDHLGVMAPEYCRLTVYRWNPEAKMKAEYPVEVRFSEVVATKRDKQDKSRLIVNERWSKAPQQMLTKCTEAAALREAFPDELGGTQTVEEMEGHVIDVPAKAPDPRGDLSGVDEGKVQMYMDAICEALDADKDENAIAATLREIDADMNKWPEVYIVVADRLAKQDIISKANWKKYLKVGLDRGESHA